MRDRLDALTSMAYPGRLIVIGRSGSGVRAIVIYAVTGRSPSSQARELVRQGDAVWTKPTDPEVLAKGNPDLLVYPALMFGRGIAVSNGKQTEDILLGGSPSAAATLEAGLRAWSFEPDAPIYTPRISGCVLPGPSAALNIIRRGVSGEPERTFHEFVPGPGEGRMISTYGGENADPLPPFRGEPKSLALSEPSAGAMAEAVFEALGPKPGCPDFRVAVACVYARAGDPADLELAIINRHERKTP
jgi:IMP cyclohydrolase-like protein